MCVLVIRWFRLRIVVPILRLMVAHVVIAFDCSRFLNFSCCHSHDQDVRLWMVGEASSSRGLVGSQGAMLPSATCNGWSFALPACYLGRTMLDRPSCVVIG